MSMRKFCKCENLKQTTTSHVVNYANGVIIVRNVPCEECEECGERYYSKEVAEQLEAIINAAKKLMQEVAIIDYSKAA